MNRFLLLALLFIPLMSSAQKTYRVSGDYTFYFSTGISLDQARAEALDQAKIQAIADKLGTVVGVSNTFVVASGKENFLSLSESEVKGEWIETLGEPEFSVSYRDNLQVVNVKVRGEIRELAAAKIQIESKILRNGTDSRFESDEFKSGDGLYISFSTPVDGYVAIYLYDYSGVYRLLPLKDDKAGSEFVEAGRDVVFFERRYSEYSKEENRYVNRVSSEYVMTCAGEAEINRIYVVFSPNRFVRAIDSASSDRQDIPAALSFESFRKWLAGSRRQDVDMVVCSSNVIIRP